MSDKYHLVCVHEFHNYGKGQRVEDPDEVAKLMADRDHHFVKVAAPAPVEPVANEPVAAAADLEPVTIKSITTSV